MSTPIKRKTERDAETKLKIIIVGAGLGGVGAAVSLLLAGHEVHVFEAASTISEVGAGIQILPNSSRILQAWGLRDRLEQYATKPSRVNIRGWKGDVVSFLDFAESAAQYPGTFYWDFHRANLHKCVLDRAVELGAQIRLDSRVTNVRVAADGATASVDVADGTSHVADLVVGADGINSTLREVLVGRQDPPIRTGDLAYRLLLSTDGMLEDAQLAPFVLNPQVNYWLGPDAHAVNYVLRGGKQLNMVLLVPDDIPEGSNTIQGNVDEMREYFKSWDPVIPKMLQKCESVSKWRLQIRHVMDSWSHPSGTFALLGDAVHATLPYLASGAGMAFEDAAVLGEMFARVKNPRLPGVKAQLLKAYADCRKQRTQLVVDRGNIQQYLYHLPDGPERDERDRKMRAQEAGEALAWRDVGLAPILLGYQVDEEVDKYWPL